MPRTHTDTLGTEQDAQRGAETVTITIPGTLDARLSPNGRAHWRTVHRLKQERKHAAFYAALGEGTHDALSMLTAPLTLHVLVAWESRRKMMDDDNLWAAFKACRDGIAEAIGVDDRHMVCGSITQTRDDEKRGFIRVAIEGGEV